LNSWRGARDAAVRLFGNAFPGSVEADVSQPTWTGPLGLHATFDHILMLGEASPVRATRLSSRFGSDHYPLLIVLHF
jgi:endonuclease/exonuclease/phosphatase (EEP) superfamily protein YafD